ncbi:hypothetical protein [Amycolatopsis sp. cmx-8-4]|uniref:hypothetical protein n=1 Tax=Amycolatopsis sp. cmx-8-4 TaxID=2790947 RepID=UPI00397A9DE5
MTTPSPETIVLVEWLQATSRGTDALATKLHIGVRSPQDERDYADYLSELANILRVHASMYDEQQHSSAQVLDISSRIPTSPTVRPELAMFGDLLAALGELVHRFTQRFVNASEHAPHSPPDDPPPAAA